ncbi:hypothetical protein PG990_005114 [Apiospora arundinis]|uniref:GPI anchored protein n=1 Tax=Apiospora arundinis TaxID=335852 RepID=A0ABR2J7T2_9PEZI
MPSITAIMLLSAASLAAAQTTVMDMFLPGFEGKNLQASVVTAMTKPPSIQYFVQCAPGTDANDCGLGPGVTVDMAPGSYALAIDEMPSFTMSVACQVDHGTAVCTDMAAGPEANDPGTTTVTMTDFSAEEFFMPVTVTAGMEKLAAFTSGSSATASKPTQEAASSSSSVTRAPSAAASPSSGGAAPTSTTSAGGAAMPQITQHAVLAGVAALVGGAMVL